MVHSDTADDAMDLTCFINGFAAPNRMQEPPPGSRLNHISDPEVHEAYRGCVHDLRSCS